MSAAFPISVLEDEFSSTLATLMPSWRPAEYRPNPRRQPGKSQPRPAMRYFQIKNFERFQHYKDRKPPWVKLYRDLWLDRDFFRLQLASKLLFIGLTTLASLTDNHIPDDPEWISQQLGLRCRSTEIDPLISAGFLLVMQDASGALANCQQFDDGEKRRGETETETETEESCAAAAADLSRLWLGEGIHLKAGELVSLKILISLRNANG